MKRRTVSLDTWMLWAAPAMLAAAFLLPSGGEGIALLLWTGLGGGLLPRPAYPYARKRRLRAHRLFLACALCWLLTAAAGALALRAAPPVTPASRFAVRAGAVFFGLAPARRLLRLPVPRRAAWPCAAALCLAAGAISALSDPGMIG